MWLFVAFVAVPLIEIALFIQIGGAIGLGWALLIVVLTAVLGTWMVRSQGIMALDQLRGSFENLTNPAEPLVHGAMILVAGAMLLTPGFFTDAVGFALLVPGIRKFLFQKLQSRIKSAHLHMGTGPEFRSESSRPDPADDIIDAEFQELEPGKRPTHNQSGWTRH